MIQKQARLRGGVIEIVCVPGSNGASGSRLITDREQLNYRQSLLIVIKGLAR